LIKPIVRWSAAKKGPSHEGPFFGPRDRAGGISMWILFACAVREKGVRLRKFL
jgi:hypothetical protein